MRTLRIVALALAIAAAAVASNTAEAQCPLEWTSGGPQAELTGGANCSTPWDPDGPGPLPQQLVVAGGGFTAGSTTGQRVMTWDGTQWGTLGNGPGTSGIVLALAVWNDVLYAAGSVTGGGVQNIAQWNGSSWQPLGSGLPDPVFCLTVWNGTLAAVCYRSSTIQCLVHTWNGTAWTTLPTVPNLRHPRASVAYQGQLCVGGADLNNTGVLERWNGTAWAPAIPANGIVRALAVRPSFAVGGVATLYVGGSFTTIDGTAASRIASTSGGSAFAWNTVAGGLPGSCKALHVRTSQLTSYVVLASVDSPSFALLRLTSSGGTWTQIGPPATAISYFNGSYHAVYAANDNSCSRYDGTLWQPVHGPGIDGDVSAAQCVGDDVFVGGEFSTIAGVAASRIARWHGGAWQSLGLGVSGLVAGGLSVDALITEPAGSLVAGGRFANAGAVTANCIARWDGANWSSLGAGMNQQVLAICRLPNGDLVAGGYFTTAGGQPCSHIARWNGTAWLPLGSGANGPVVALLVRSDGVLFAGGAFSSAGGVACANIAQWDGTSWSPVGTGCNGAVLGLAERPSGDLVAVGAFTMAGGLPAAHCARWTPFGWIPTGIASGNPVSVVSVLPDGDIVVVSGGASGEELSRWDGSAWSAMATITSGDPNLPGSVRCLAQAANGELVVGGSFRFAGGGQARNLARARSTCAASAQAYGIGCNSAAGALTITADTLPWLGASFRTTTTGIAANSLCLSVIGFTEIAIPLSALLGEGQAGCSLLASPDFTSVLPTSAGTAHASFVLANTPALVGVPFFAQTIPFEWNGAGALTAVRGSNALALVIGAF